MSSFSLLPNRLLNLTVYTSFLINSERSKRKRLEGKGTWKSKDKNSEIMGLPEEKWQTEDASTKSRPQPRTTAEWGPGEETSSSQFLSGQGEYFRLPTDAPDNCFSGGYCNAPAGRALEDEGIAILLKIWLAPLKKHWVHMIPFLITFRNGLLIAFQLLETFGSTSFTAAGDFLSILSKRSFK